MNVLISGAQFANKGAQSLLFTVMDQIRKHYKKVEFYYLPLDNYKNYNEKDYRFQVVYFGTAALNYEKGGITRYKFLIKNEIKRILGRKVLPIRDVRKLHDILPHIDVWIDVSGYQLGSDWPIDINNKFLNYITLSQKYNIPIILMPQSFGPFHYGTEQAVMEHKIKEILPQAKMIFAREKAGYDLLNDLGIRNIALSPDIVLQGNEIDWKNIWVEKPQIQYPVLETRHNVGIVPNFQTVDHGNETKVLEIYEQLIDKLLELQKEVYIFRHSEDLDICKKIYDLFKYNPRVHLFEGKLDCIEYGKYIQQFDYIIASRYHAIVHAYKERIPSIILGWAVKYQELSEHFAQQNYVFDITGNNFNLDALIHAVEEMDKSYMMQRQVIDNELDKIMENTCFKKCWEILDEIETQ